MRMDLDACPRVAPRRLRAPRRPVRLQGVRRGRARRTGGDAADCSEQDQHPSPPGPVLRGVGPLSSAPRSIRSRSRSSAFTVLESYRPRGAEPPAGAIRGRAERSAAPSSLPAGPSASDDEGWPIRRSEESEARETRDARRQVERVTRRTDNGCGDGATLHECAGASHRSGIGRGSPHFAGGVAPGGLYHKLAGMQIPPAIHAASALRSLGACLAFR